MQHADPLGTSRLLLEQGRAHDALALQQDVSAAGLAGAPVHSLMAMVLHQLGDFPGCAQNLREAARLAPGDGAAEFALASICNKLGEEAEAEAAARRALAKGEDEAPVHALLGRILARQGRLDEAEKAWRAAARRMPALPQAQRELADLVWMRTGDVHQARVALDAAPQTPEITTILVHLLETAGEVQAAYDIAAARAARDPSLHLLAARTALRLDPRVARSHLDSLPGGIMTAAQNKAAIETDLALGRTSDAARRAEALHARYPADQGVTALMATAWRLEGDPRYGALYDYGRLVGCHDISVPQGWSDLGLYLEDLGRALDGHHVSRTHPMDQSLRHGSQTCRSLKDYPDPAIRALFAAIDSPIRRHIAVMDGSVRDHEIAGAWSVRLNSGGFHLNHVHPEGWLSSVFYVRVPHIPEGRQGVLTFGEPGPPTRPSLGSEHLVRPRPGLLVLFPSYMWHGTVPFDLGGTRLSCAFDIVPR